MVRECGVSTDRAPGGGIKPIAGDSYLFHTWLISRSRSGLGLLGHRDLYQTCTRIGPS